MSARADVIAYLDAIDAQNARTAPMYGDVVHAFNDVELRRSDLRELVALTPAQEEVDRLSGILSSIAMVVQTVDTETNEALQDWLAERVWEQIPEALRADPTPLNTEESKP